MAGYGEGALTGASSGATTGAAVGSVIPGVGTGIGAIIGGSIGAVFGGVMGNSASRAKKWQKIASQRIADYNALQNRRTFLASLRSLRAQRASQLQQQSMDLNNYVSGEMGALASLGSQAAYNYQQFDLDIWHQNRIQSALNNAGIASSQTSRTANIFDSILQTGNAFATYKTNVNKAEAYHNQTNILRNIMGYLDGNTGVTYSD